MTRTALDYCVVIPAHNAESFLHEALASIAQQTIAPREIVVVDDGSRDRTVEVALKNGAIVVSTGRPSGPSVARNRGVASTTAPIIAFLDADDEWKPDHAERLLAAMHASGAVFGSAAIEHFGAESRVISAKLQGGVALDIRNDLLVDNPIIQSSAAIRRDAFVGAGGYDEAMRMSEDYDLWNRLALVGAFTYVSEPTVRRRVHAGQLTHRASTVMLEAAWRVRRHTVERRWNAATDAERREMLERLDIAAHQSLESAIRAGDSSGMRAVRAELAATDVSLALATRLAAIGGAGRRGLAVVQNLKCIGRMVLNRVRPIR